LGYTSLHSLHKTRPSLPGGPEQEERDNKLTLSNAWVRAECWDKRHIDEVPEHESSNFKAWLSGHNAVQFLGQNHMSQSVEHRASEAYQGGLSLPQVAADSLLSYNMTGWEGCLACKVSRKWRTTRVSLDLLAAIGTGHMKYARAVVSNYCKAA
jgi:hypothetical protein